MDKKELKQYSLDSKEHCVVYLLRIITTAEKCIERLKIHNSETEKILNYYREKESDTIPYSVYSEMLDKTIGIQSYLLNIIGDSQKSSISYFKYRKQVEKLIKQNKTDIKIKEHSEDLTEILNNFNRMRNWINHIPESLLNAEEKSVEDGLLYKQPRNPIEIYRHSSVTYEYFEDLYVSSINFYNSSRTIIQAAKRDYGALIGERVRIEHVDIETPVTLKRLQPTIMSAKIQGLQVNE